MDDPTLDPIGVIGSPDVVDLGADDTNHLITRLSPNSPYRVTVCASTSVGCGVNTTMTQYTTQDDKTHSHYHLTFTNSLAQPIYATIFYFL